MLRFGRNTVALTGNLLRRGRISNLRSSICQPNPITRTYEWSVFEDLRAFHNWFPESFMKMSEPRKFVVLHSFTAIFEKLQSLKCSFRSVKLVCQKPLLAFDDFQLQGSKLWKNSLLLNISHFDYRRDNKMISRKDSGEGSLN